MHLAGGKKPAADSEVGKVRKIQRFARPGKPAETTGDLFVSCTPISTSSQHAIQLNITNYNIFLDLNSNIPLIAAQE